MIFCFVELFSQILVGTDEKREYPNCEKSTTLFNAKFLHNVRASEKIKLRSKKRNVLFSQFGYSGFSSVPTEI